MHVDLASGEIVLRATVTGAGPTVLLLHAGGERRGVWAPVAARMARCGLRTVAYDQRGHGDSSGEATALRPLADDVIAMVAREPAPVVVVGASLGGFAAVAALADPATAQRVAGLVLVDVVPDPDPARVRSWLGANGLLDRSAGSPRTSSDPGPELLGIVAASTVPILLVRGTGSPMIDADVDRLRAARPVTRGHRAGRRAPGGQGRPGGARRRRVGAGPHGGSATADGLATGQSAKGSGCREVLSTACNAGQRARACARLVGEDGECGPQPLRQPLGQRRVGAARVVHPHRDGTPVAHHDPHTRAALDRDRHGLQLGEPAPEHHQLPLGVAQGGGLLARRHVGERDGWQVLALQRPGRHPRDDRVAVRVDDRTPQPLRARLGAPPRDERDPDVAARPVQLDVDAARRILPGVPGARGERRGDPDGAHDGPPRSGTGVPRR